MPPRVHAPPYSYQPRCTQGSPRLKLQLTYRVTLENLSWTLGAPGLGNSKKVNSGCKCQFLHRHAHAPQWCEAICCFCGSETRSYDLWNLQVTYKHRSLTKPQVEYRYLINLWITPGFRSLYNVCYFFYFRYQGVETEGPHYLTTWEHRSYTGTVQLLKY